MKDKPTDTLPSGSNGFCVRSYPKSELAHLYLPYLPVRSALRTWNEWVQFHPTLYQELQRAGYRKNSKFLSPAQVRLVVEALGNP